MAQHDEVAHVDPEVVGGFGAILFRLMVDFFQGFAIGHGEHTAELLAPLPWWRKLILPVIGALLVGPLVHHLAREAKGHGVPEVLGAIVFRAGVIRPEVIVPQEKAEKAVQQNVAEGGLVRARVAATLSLLLRRRLPLGPALELAAATASAIVL